ncbi:hypothetical protein [Nocardioides sp. SYSU DS0651]|uniref:hypothetical protein n=1 Tax=Nocardioides sp. SYSU DS0651 TaxID=3415955 RepID=UPI003F4C7C7A
MTQPPDQPPNHSGSGEHRGFRPPAAGPTAPYPGGGGYPPYGGAPGAPGSHGPAPSPYQPPRGSTGRTVAIVVSVVVVVLLAICGGVVGLVVWAVNNVGDALDEYDPERAGGRDNPISVEVGEAFEIDGVEYADGWRVQPSTDTASGTTIVGLRGENDRDDGSSETVYLNFTFVGDGDTEVGRVTCTSSGFIAHGNTEELECQGYDEIPESFDHIEVAASL